MNFYKHHNRGLVGTVIFIVVAVLTISFFGISIKDVAESDTSKSNFGYIKEVGVKIWDKYLKKSAAYLYEDIWLDLIWHPLINKLKQEKSDSPASSYLRLNFST